MRKLIVFFLLGHLTLSSQSLGINQNNSSPNANAILDISSTEKGLLIPRMTRTERNTLAMVLGSAETGMMVYDTEVGDFYFWKEGAFHRINLNTGIIDTDEDTEIRVEDSPDDDVIRFYTAGVETWRIRDDRLEAVNIFGNLALGDSSLYNNQPVSINQSAGSRNTALGQYSLSSNSNGFHNTAVGYQSLFRNSTGFQNTAIGRSALFSNTTGNANIGIGTLTLLNNSASSNNIAVGNNALGLGTTGSGNIAMGSRALEANEGARNIGIGLHSMRWNNSGNGNIGIGVGALHNNTSENGNVAIGDSVLYNSGGISGIGQVAIGYKSQLNNISGVANTSVGSYALHSNTSGKQNTSMGHRTLEDYRGDNSTAVGFRALSNSSSGDENTAVGSFASFGNLTRHRRTAIGYSANSVGNNGNNTGIGNDADCTAAHQVRIGNDAVTSIGGYANWTNISDGKFKKNVQENVPGLEFIEALRPVTYQLNIDAIHGFYKREYNEEKRKRYDEPTASGTMIRSGFIAQEVEAIALRMGYDFSGVDAPKNDKDYYGLRYAAFVVPLVKAVQEQQAIIDEQAKKLLVSKSKLEDLESRMANLEKLSITTNNQ